MFSLLGLILTIEGIITYSNISMYQKSLGVNINLWSGIGMLVFGVLMIVFGRKK
jgi:hypothetical protein